MEKSLKVLLKKTPDFKYILHQMQLLAKGNTPADS